MRPLAGKTVLITGAARGIGLCAAREFARAGCNLVLVDRDRAALDEAARSLPGRVATFAFDVADEQAVAALAEQTLQSFGAVDVLVNNAGIGHAAELASTPRSTWRTLLDVNFWGPLYLIDAFLPSMRARRSGHIINVASGQAFLRMPG